MSGLLRGHFGFRLLSGATALAVGLLLVLPGLNAPAHAATPVMGRSVITADELADWYATTGRTPDLPLTMRQLARHFIQEGAAEGVRGDIAFAQSILETAYFTFPSSGQVRPAHNNYGGLGAVDGGNNPNSFPTPQIGVRAQIQHLRAYADPTVTESNLANPLVSPRFHLVNPKGRAPNWEDMGGGNWATDPLYGAKILDIYRRITSFVEQQRRSIPITGDWNGDGRSTPGWYRDGRVYLRTTSTTGPPNVVFNYGRRGDIPVVGDWNGDGRDTIGIIRNGEWHLRNSLSGGNGDHAFRYGRVRSGDYPITGDWNGDGRTTVGVVRDGEWHLRDRLAGGAADSVFVYGRVLRGDVPVTGDWNGDGRTTAGVVRADVWHLRNVNRAGAADVTFTYGRSTDIAVTGDWNGNGRVTAGVVRGTTWHLRNFLSGGAANRTFTYSGW